MPDVLRARRFETLALGHRDAAYNYACRLTRDATEAQDVVQEAFLRAFQYFASFRGDNVRPWLFRIVRNAFFDSRRMAAARATVPLDADGEGVDQALLVDGAPTPEQALIETDATRVLEEALQALPPSVREILVLREVEELSYKEIAYVLEAPIGTVMSRLARARAVLSAEIRRRLGES